MYNSNPVLVIHSYAFLYILIHFYTFLYIWFFISFIDILVRTCCDSQVHVKRVDLHSQLCHFFEGMFELVIGKCWACDLNLA